jgi:N-acetyl-gamma-glutamyl-phosphate reductase
MSRGILATCYAHLRDGVSPEQVQAAYAQAYQDEPFVHLVSQPPHTKHTTGTNHAFVHPIVDPEAHRLIVLAALDNLGKGAAGQAIQCANCLFDLPETTGLGAGGVFP